MTVPKLLLTGSHDVTTFSNGRAFPTRFLTDALPDVETALFFAKVYDLAAQDVALVLRTCVPSTVVTALTEEAGMHSMSLQDYLLEEFYDDDEWSYVSIEHLEKLGGVKAPVHAEILPEVWKNLELEIAESISKVAETIASTIEHMPGKTGTMVFATLAKMNKRRPTLGAYLPGFKHQQQKRVLVVFDVSGSMSQATVATIVDDVVGLAYECNASLAIVSNTCTWYGPGQFGTADVLRDAEYGGTHYETLVPLFKDQDWDVVISVADYDSSPAAQRALLSCKGKIGQLFDVSLVSRSTYLAECLQHMATEVRPLLIAADHVRLTY